MTNLNKHVLTIERIFNAPLDIVWKAWTEKEHIEKWFGPQGFTTRVDENDMRVGGRSKYVIIAPDGTEYPSVGVYIEIVDRSKIVTTDEFGEQHKEQMNTDLPKILSVTTEFEDLNTQTKLIITIEHPSEEDKEKHKAMGVKQGWNSSFEKLDELLQTINGKN